MIMNSFFIVQVVKTETDNGDLYSAKIIDKSLSSDTPENVFVFTSHHQDLNYLLTGDRNVLEIIKQRIVRNFSIPSVPATKSGWINVLDGKLEE